MLDPPWLGILVVASAVAALSFTALRRRGRGETSRTERPRVPAARAFGRNPWANTRQQHDAASVLGLSRAELLKRVAPPPVDLSRPISDEPAWASIRAHAADPAYRRAVEALRGRYQFAPPMLLANTLRELMERKGLSFREAVLQAAADDGLRRGPGR